MNPSLLTPAMNKIVDQTELHNFGKATSLGEEQLSMKISTPCFAITLHVLQILGEGESCGELRKKNFFKFKNFLDMNNCAFLTKVLIKSCMYFFFPAQFHSFLI